MFRLFVWAIVMYNYNGVHVVLELDAVIMLIIVFLLLEHSFTFYRAAPKYDTIPHYSMKIGKINYFESGWCYYMDTPLSQSSKYYLFQAKFCKHDCSNLFLCQVLVVRI